jgi:hypothetical protein
MGGGMAGGMGGGIAAGAGAGAALDHHGTNDDPTWPGTP